MAHYKSPPNLGSGGPPSTYRHQPEGKSKVRPWDLHQASAQALASGVGRKKPRGDVEYVHPKKPWELQKPPQLISKDSFIIPQKKQRVPGKKQSLVLAEFKDVGGNLWRLSRSLGSLGLGLGLVGSMLLHRFLQGIQAGTVREREWSNRIFSRF